MGVRILTAVVTEMNTPGTKNAVKHRKAAIGFRDAQLLPIFRAALAMLQAVLQSGPLNPGTEKMKEAILQLMKACLAFDFIGAAYEESSDDVGSIQVPAGWKVVLEQPEYQDVLWECWKTFSGTTSILVMECLSQTASIRRSVFSSEEVRNKYIFQIMRESMWTLNTAAGRDKLQDVGNFHEFSRMLSRFKNTYQLAEWSPNSVSYLLIFWNKTVSSLSSAKQSAEQVIEKITVNLTHAYLKSRLDCVQAVMDGEADDPLESEENLVLSLEMFANIVRTKYKESGQFLINNFKDLLQKYRELILQASTLNGTTLPPVGASDIKESLIVIEMQLTWMVYIMAACIGGRVMYQSTSEQDQLDGEFACEILGFIHQLQVWTEQRSLYLASADAHLYIQSSIIYFFTQFRSTYIGEDSSKAVKVYTQLSARWGLNTPDQVLDVIINTSLGNLRTSGDPTWRKQGDQLVLRTLKLFANLSAGYNSVKLIRKLDTTRALLKNHDSSEFQFLDPARGSASADVGRCRTMYYTMLSRILFAEDNVDADFWRFVKPWETSLDQIVLAFEGGGQLNEKDIQLILLGLFRDLRGFVTSISNRRQFNLFYEWFYPAYTPVVRRAIEIWPQNAVAIAALRFWHEFATNKSSRVTFDSSSPNGILLFRETSLLNRAVTSESTLWSEKYKGIMLYFNIMSVSLSGKYANFGVFRLYGDKALDQVLEVFFQLILAVPVDDMVSFPKLALSYFSVIDVFAQDHMAGMTMVPHSVLAYMLRSMGEVIPLHSVDATCSTLACSALDKICTFVLNWLIKNKVRRNGDVGSEEMLDDGLLPVAGSSKAHLLGPGASVDLTNDKLVNGLEESPHWLVEYVLLNKNALSYLFMVLFQVMAFENRSNHWSLSRPLLGLILLNRGFFTDYTANFVRIQLPDRQEAVQKAVDGLLEGIENNLTTANRDRFTTNATAFRRECAQMTLIAINPDSGSSMS
ncbi:Exportin 7 [Mortierella claussenii]|nr:Exportin 7 [Mortierella claussenii]